MGTTPLGTTPPSLLPPTWLQVDLGRLSLWLRFLPTPTPASALTMAPG